MIIFTGIVQEVGFLQRKKLSANNYSLVIRADKVLESIQKGDSIAVNGVCLTVTSLKDNSFTADIMPETIRKTNLKDLKRGEALNLEQALTINDFLGGHLVSGHVDGTGKVKAAKEKENAHILEIDIKKEMMDYIINKGSICINGVSLTVMECRESSVLLSLIPETLNNTNLKFLEVGDWVNIETDLMGKYIVETIKKIMQGNGNDINTDNDEIKNLSSASVFSKSFLEENGFA